jgi:hypothetical protein
MPLSAKHLLGFALFGALSFQSSLAAEGAITAKFSYSRPGISNVQFKQDVDVCVRKAGTLSFVGQPPGGGNNVGVGRMIVMKNSPPDPSRFMACMQEKSYRLDRNGPYDTGWITLRPHTQDL